MAELFTERYLLLWTVGLAAALFFPVRRLIWVLMVRRAMNRSEVDEAEQERLRRRAGVTAALLVFVFSYLYSSAMLPG